MIQPRDSVDPVAIPVSYLFLEMLDEDDGEPRPSPAEILAMIRPDSQPLPAAARRGRGRPKRFDGIAERIVASIASGEFAPGQRMLSRRAMVDKFQATIVTVQKALAQLEAAGVVRSDGWQGTFVSERPPCLSRFGLIIPDSRDQNGQFPSLYYDSLVTAARSMGNDSDWVVFEGLLTGGKGLKALRSDLARHRLAGLVTIFARPMQSIIRELVTFGIPIVQIGGPTPDPGCRHLDFDRAALASLAARRLAHAGSRAPVAAVLVNADQSHLAIYRNELSQQGIYLRPGAILGFDHRHSNWLADWLTDHLQRPAAGRPDGLLLLDDNFIGVAAATLQRLGIVPGRDLPVVTSVNYPCDRLPPGFIGVGCDSQIALSMARAELLLAQRGLPSTNAPIPMISPDP